MQDFRDCQGIGHLYLGTFMMVLFGGDCYASLYAFDLLAMLSMLLLFWTIGYSVLQDKTLVAATTGTVFMLLIIICD